MNKSTRVLCIVSACLFLFACGQRGALVLPQPPQENQQQPSSTAPSEIPAKNNANSSSEENRGVS